MTLDEKLLTQLYSPGSQTLEKISFQLGVSLEIVLGRVEELRKLGFEIQVHPQEGCQIHAVPDFLIGDEIKARLNQINPSSARIGNEILVFESTQSTNDVVQRLGASGHTEGLVVFAETQTKGRGRHGRVWISPPRKGLWFSFLLRPKIELASVSRLMMFSAVAVVRALERTTQLPFQVKWPNDILCRGRKLAGILVELNAASRGIAFATIGIGINVNLASEDFPEEWRNGVTSLQMESGRAFPRSELAAEILGELDRFASILEHDDFSYVLDNWLELDCTLGKQVTILNRDGRKMSGLASSLDPDGALLVRLDDGVVERVTGGEVTLEKI